MSTPRRSLSGLAALAASTLMLAGAATAHAAPGISITSPETGAYTNDTKPLVEYSDAAGGPVELRADNAPVGTNTSGQTSSAIIPDSPISALVRDDVVLTVVDSIGQSDPVTVIVNQVPTIMGGPAEGTMHSADGVEFDVWDAIPGNPVVFYDGSTEVGREFADNAGKLEDYTLPTLSPGERTITAVTLDDAGTPSSPDTSSSFIASPSAPTFAKLHDRAQVNQAQPAIAFTDVDPQAGKVTLYEAFADEDEESGFRFVVIGETGTIEPDGTATITPNQPLSEGEHLLRARQTVNDTETDDYQAGVHGFTGVTVNTGAPTLSSNQNGELIRTMPYVFAEGALSSHGENSNSVKFYVTGPAGLSTFTEETTSQGYAYFEPQNLADGSYSVYAVSVDDNDNESDKRSNTVTFTLDTTAPGAPTLLSPANGSVITINRPQVSVNAEPGSRVSFIVDYAGEWAEVVADSDGNATFQVTEALSDGEHTVSAMAIDAADNYNDDSTVIVTFTVKTAAVTPPVPPVVTPPVDPTPTPTPATPKAPTKVSVSSGTLTRVKPVTVKFTLTKASTVRVTITRTVKGKTVTVATVNVKYKKAGNVTYKLKTKVGGKTLKKGKYKVSLQTVNGKKASKPSAGAKITVR